MRLQTKGIGRRNEKFSCMKSIVIWLALQRSAVGGGYVTEIPVGHCRGTTGVALGCQPPSRHA